jgi:three-Cys-motif partner protein
MDPVSDDGLLTASIKAHSLQKLRKHAYFVGIFARAVKRKIRQRCYIGICTGPRRAEVQETGDIVETSPIHALRVADSFSKYILCDENLEAVRVLRKRVEAIEEELGSTFDVEYVVGDANERVAQIEAAIPSFDASNTLLTFCFLDPFAANVRFETIRSLCAHRNVDLLVVLPVSHDARRNRERYLEPENTRIEEWLAEPGWRDRWAGAEGEGEDFVYFLARVFGEKMEALGYLPTQDRDVVPVRVKGKQVLLYLLAFYSKHELGLRLWRDANERTEEQTSLDI